MLLANALSENSFGKLKNKVNEHVKSLNEEKIKIISVSFSLITKIGQCCNEDLENVDTRIMELLTLVDGNYYNKEQCLKIEKIIKSALKPIRVSTNEIF
jgi:hypothetical protein